MDKIKLGRTGLMVSRSGFGAIPIQRIDREEAKRLLLKAYDNGINFFDTAIGYTDSEEKIAYALSGLRKNIILATKTPARDRKTFFENLETSLRRLKTDYIDIYQFHNPAEAPGRDSELYGAMLEARRKGLIRFISITNHRLSVATEAVNSGLYDTLQFPFSCLSSETDVKLVNLCREKDVGFIAMKALSGGLITNVTPTFAFIRELNYPVPIWGLEREWQLDQFLALEKNPPAMDDGMRASIEKERKELAGAFCRGCEYCMPCPVGIPISTAARLSHVVARMAPGRFLEEEWKEKMELIEECRECGQCTSRCPYELDTPSLLKKELILYREYYEKNAKK